MSSQSLKLNESNMKFIPKNWKYKKLKETGKFANGLNKNKEDYGYGCLHVNIDDVFGSLIIDISKIGRVNATKEEIKRYSLENGDLCLLRSSVKPDGIGYPSLFENSQVSVVFSGFLIQFKPNPDFWNPRYLTFLLRSKDVRKNVISKSTSSANTNINQKAYGSIQVLIPTLQEQKKIAELLFNIDELIQNFDSFISKKYNIKQGAMQKLLTGEIRLSGFNDDWIFNKIKNIARVIRGASPRPKGNKRYYGGNIPRLMVEDVTRDGKFVSPTVDFLTKEGEQRSRPCKKGTLTIVCSGTVGIPSFLAIDACIHDGFLALIDIQKNISKDYLYHQFSNLRNKFESSATHGGIFTNLTTTILEEFVIALPSTKEEQLAIAKILSDMDLEIKELETKRDKYIMIKNAITQKLLTGEIRLT